MDIQSGSGTRWLQNVKSKQIVKYSKQINKLFSIFNPTKLAGTADTYLFLEKVVPPLIFQYFCLMIRYVLLHICIHLYLQLTTYILSISFDSSMKDAFELDTCSNK